jgi:tripartite ATP-independent transporter DctM subunit
MAEGPPMSILAESTWLLVVLLVLLGAGVWIAPVLLITGYVGMALFTQAPSGPLMATTIWSASSNWALTSLPLFIWMGEILFRSRISQDMFRGLAPWVGRLPGGLMHTNVLGCGIFAAISGSSAATAATIGRMTVPELTQRGYEPAMVAGSLAGAGTLGLLIPPSIIMIVYGVAADVSIARLFVAGVLPGILLMALFSGFIAIWALARPELQPPREAAVSFKDKLAAGKFLLPTVLLIAAVVGSIYTGVATPTESAALGVLGALVLSAWSGSLSRAVFVEGVSGAVKTSCMITFILMGASFLTAAMGFTGIPRALAEWIAHQGLAPWQLIAVLTALYIVLGCFIDGISMVVLTAAVILPSVKAAGIDLLWFGIFVVLVVEMAQITPPVGFNLYVLQNLTGKDMFYIARASLPFFFLMVVAVALIWVFPQIVTVLPAQMFNLSK